MKPILFVDKNGNKLVRRSRWHVSQNGIRAAFQRKTGVYAIYSLLDVEPIEFFDNGDKVEVLRKDKWIVGTVTDRHDAGISIVYSIKLSNTTLLVPYMLCKKNQILRKII